jgi:hypothetical protein
LNVAVKSLPGEIAQRNDACDQNNPADQSNFVHLGSLAQD